MKTQAATLTSRADVLEHVMRLTGDDLLADPFTRVEPGSREFFAALGRLLSDTALAVQPGSPLHRWAAASPGAPLASWRDAAATAPSCLWGELELLRTLHGPLPAADPLSELIELRGRP